MGIRQYISNTARYISDRIDSIRASYEGNLYIVKETGRGQNKIGKLIEQFNSGKISPEKFSGRLQDLKSAYESATRGRTESYKDRRVAGHYIGFIDDMVGFIKKNTPKIKASKDARKELAVDLLMKFLDLDSQIWSDVAIGPPSEKDVAEVARMAGELKEKLKKERLEGIVSSFFYICLGLLVGHIFVNTNITGFAILGANSSTSGRVILILFLLSSLLLLLARGATGRLEGRLRGITVKLPNLGCQLLEIEHDKRNDVFIVKFYQRSGLYGQAIRDTGVLIPTDNPAKIRYERVAEPKERAHGSTRTVELPNINDRYMGTEYDPDRKLFIINYESPSVVFPAIQRTRIPLPVEDESRIVYRDVRTGKEHGGKKTKR